MLAKCAGFFVTLVAILSGVSAIAGELDVDVDLGRNQAPAFYTQWWFWLIIVLVFIIVVVALTRRRS